MSKHRNKTSRHQGRLETNKLLGPVSEVIRLSETELNKGKFSTYAPIEKGDQVDWH